MSNALSGQIGQEVISMFADFFPDLQQQLDKLTVIRYDQIKETNAQRDEKLCQREHTNPRTKV